MGRRLVESQKRCLVSLDFSVLNHQICPQLHLATQSAKVALHGQGTAAVLATFILQMLKSVKDD